MSVTIRVEESNNDTLSINLSNSNFIGMMKAVGARFDENDLAGVFAVDASAFILASCCKLYFSDDLSSAIIPMTTSGNVLSYGRDREYVISRLESFIRIFSIAVLENKKVTYA